MDAPPRTRGGALAAAIIGIVTTLLLVALALVWQRAAAPPARPLERYFPLESGTTQLYRITEADGTTTYQSTNVSRWAGPTLSSLVDATTLSRALALSLGLDPENIPDDELDTLVERGSRALLGAEVRQLTWGDGEAPRANRYQLLSLPDGIELLTLDGENFVPPAPMLPPRLAVGERVTREGTFGTLPYRSTISVEAEEALTTPVGALERCWRLATALEIGEVEARSTQWLCPGVGLAREEYVQSGVEGVRLTELVAARVPERFLSDGRALPPSEPTLDAAPPEGAALPAEIGRLWSYSPTVGGDVRAAPLPVGDLLIYATEAGEVIALDRESRAERWRFQAGGGITDAPTVAGGRLFFGSADRHAYALDAARGTLLWAFRARDVVAASPVVAGDLAFVGSEDGTLHALDVSTGEERWRAALGGAIGYRAAVAGSLVVVGTDGGALYAFDAATGAERWAFAADDAIAAPPRAADGALYVGAYDDTLYALAAGSEARDGELLWEFALDDSPSSAIALDAERLYLTLGSGTLLAVERATGEEAWRYESLDTLRGAPLVMGDEVLIARQADLLVVEAASGAERRRIEGVGTLDIQSGLSTDGEALYVGSHAGAIVALGASSTLPWEGSPLWTARAFSSALFQTSDTLSTPPTAANGALYLASDGGVLYRVAPESGAAERVGAIDGSGLILHPPAVAAGKLVVLTQGGELIALDEATGEEAWRVALGGSSRSAPLAFEGAILVAVTVGEASLAAAFDAATGEPLWERRLPNSLGLDSVALLDEGRLFVTTERVHALDAATGEPLWEALSAEDAPVQLAAGGGRITVVGLPEEEWVLSTFDAASGAPVGEPITIAMPSFPALFARPASDGERVVVMANDGSSAAFDLAAGRELWRQPPGGEPSGPLVLHGDLVLYVERQNRLVARALDDGRVVADFALGSTSSRDFTTFQPVLVGDVLYAAGYQDLVALRLR